MWQMAVSHLLLCEDDHHLSRRIKWNNRSLIILSHMETTIVYWGYIGIMENKMEIAIVCRDYIHSPAFRLPLPAASLQSPCRKGKPRNRRHSRKV